MYVTDLSARLPTKRSPLPRPAPLRVRRARAHRSPRLRAARDIHRARLLAWQARDGRDRKRRGCAGGLGVHARARVKPAGASARRLCGGYTFIVM